MSAISTATPTLANNETHVDRKQATSVAINNRMRRSSHPQYIRDLPSSNEGTSSDIWWHNYKNRDGIVDQHIYVENINLNVEIQHTDDVVSIGDSCDSIKYTKRRLSAR